MKRQKYEILTKCHEKSFKPFEKEVFMNNSKFSTKNYCNSIKIVFLQRHNNQKTGGKACKRSKTK